MKLNFTFKPMYYFLLLVWPFWRICHFSHSKIASNYVTDISDRCKWYANYKLKLPVSVVYSKEVTFWQTDRHGKLRLPVPAVYSKVVMFWQTDRQTWQTETSCFSGLFKRTDRQTWQIKTSCFSSLFKKSLCSDRQTDRQTWQSETSCFSGLFIKDYDLTEMTQWIKKKWMQNLPEFLLIIVLFSVFSLLDFNLLAMEAHAMKRWNIIEKR